ncbi:MAG: lysophospholipid acyltransferase family protein [Bacteroidetes bacterium]|nr:lysophospholipid acyltransferase family protein [Bacteroidota bacterium]
MITYYLIAPLLFLLSKLPTNALYRLADVLAFFLRVVFHYRQEVVYKNLRNSFPNKSEEEIQQIAKESYTHLADRIVENIRCIGMSREEADQRIIIKNPEVITDLYNQGRHVVIIVGHIGAWEFNVYKLSALTKHELFGLVSRVKNPYFNRMIQRTRGRMGMNLVYTQESKAFFNREFTRPSLTTFIADQSPSNKLKAYWTTFLNQPTAFFTGPEGFAKLRNAAVFYAHEVQIRRGYFEAEFIPITYSPNETAPNEITEKFARLMEKTITQYPSDWLWSHKRWKHKKEAV